MWMVLPTKNCKCVTCETLRTMIDEDGNLLPGSSVAVPTGPSVMVNVPTPAGWGDSSKKKTG